MNSDMGDPAEQIFLVPWGSGLRLSIRKQEQATVWIKCMFLGAGATRWCPGVFKKSFTNAFHLSLLLFQERTACMMNACLVMAGMPFLLMKLKLLTA